ncbi:MAG: hypothetical protein ACYC6I_07360 [Bacillota bacterium]
MFSLTLTHFTWQVARDVSVGVADTEAASRSAEVLSALLGAPVTIDGGVPVGFADGGGEAGAVRC